MGIIPYGRRLAGLEQLAADATLETNPALQGLGQMLWDRLASGKLNDSTASERTIDMHVIATVGTIDPTSICEDENCAQKGEMFKDHTVVHKGRGRKKGTRGECPHCKGPLHNTNDAAQLIAFQCLWRQAFGERAKRTPVNASTLTSVAHQIGVGSITGWADRNVLHTILAPAPKAPPPPAATPSPVVAPVAAASTTRPVATSAPTAVPPPLPTTSGEDVAAKAEKQRKLREALRGAKVNP